MKGKLIFQLSALLLILWSCDSGKNSAITDSIKSPDKTQTTTGKVSGEKKDWSSNITFYKKPIRFLKCQYRLGKIKKPGLIVLGYHNVLPLKTTDDLYVVSLRNFNDQLLWLKKFFDVISIENINTCQDIKKPAVVITFDDGKDNNYTFAYTALAAHGLTAAFFVITDFVNTKGCADWNQLNTMQKNGMSICSHSCTHPDFGTQKMDKAWQEFSVSRQILKEHIPAAADMFAYPFGNPQNMKESDRALLDSAGYRYSFAFGGGAFTMIEDRHRVPRYMVVDIQGVTLIEQLLNEFEKL